MTGVAPETAFVKMVVQTAVEFGFHVGSSIQEYTRTLPDEEWFKRPMWTDLKADIRAAIVLCADTNPRHVMDFATKLTYAVHRGAYGRYEELMRPFFDPQNMTVIWSNASHDAEASYAFVCYLLLEGLDLKDKLSLEKTITAVLGQPFNFKTQRNTWDQEVTLAFFGQVWHSFYMDSTVKYDDLLDMIELILQQRPPIVGRAVQNQYPVELPIALDCI